MRLTAPALALTLALASACGGGGEKKPRPQTGCTRQADCSGGLVCFDGSCVASLPASAACADPGAPPQLLAGAAVAASDPGAGVCSYAIRTPILPAGQGLGQVQDLGAHVVGTELPFKVPPGTWSITIFEQAVEGTAVPTITEAGTPYPNVAVPTAVKEPDGDLYFSDTADVAGGNQGVFYFVYTPYFGTLTIPNTTRGLELARAAGELPAGDWKLTVNDWAYECETAYQGSCAGDTGGQYRVHVVTQGPPAGTGRLDLDVYLATDDGQGGARFTAAQAAASPAMQRMFDTTSTLLGRGGVCLGTVTFHDVPEWARQRFATTEIDDATTCDEAAQLYRLAQAETPNVQVFLVDALVPANAPPGNTLLGLTGAIPGPSGLPGSPTSGAIIYLGDLQTCSSAPLDVDGCEADLDGYVAAHEIGHWLGLYHPTEQGGTFFDPLTDTGRCPCASCASTCTNATVTTSMCLRDATCTGGDNLMFWLVDPFRSVGNVSRQQGELMRANPAVNLE